MKRILMIGAGILDKSNATGITLRSIFDEIDKKNLMGVSWGEPIRTNRYNVVHLSYRLISFGRLLDNSFFKKISGSIRKVEKQKQTVSGQGTLSNKQRVLQYVRQWVALLPARSKVRISVKEMETIRAFAPQVIYTIGESVTTLNIAYRLSKELNIPIVIHFMDNWRHSIEWASNPLLKHYQNTLSYWCDLCYSRSSICIAIGDRMAEVYEKETGIPHATIMNSIDTKIFACAPKKEVDVKRFVYAGGLHLGREKVLRMIGECIDSLSEEMGIPADFSIYTAPENIDLYAGSFAHLRNTKLHCAVSHDRIQDIYAQADILVHVESAELEHNSFFMYSVSTKISEYLATGRTMLFFGPNNISLYELLHDKQLAYTVSNEVELKKTIECMLRDTQNKFAANAQRYAQQHFDLTIARKRFQTVIDAAELLR